VDRLIWQVFGGIAASTFIAGAICTWVAIRASLQRLRRSAETDGIVVERLPGAQGDADGVTTFEFGDGRGARHRATVLTTAAPHAVGQPVRVRYDPRSPEDAVIATPAGSVLLFGIVCLVLGAAGLVVWWQTWIPKRRPS
jgi:hypothetical protein